MNREYQINRFLEGQGFNVVTMIVFIALAVAGCVLTGFPVSADDSGLCLPSGNLWLQGGTLSMTINAACIVAVGYLFKHLNRLHGFIRADASIALSAFLMLESATPAVNGVLFEGTIMLVVVAVSAYILFDSYQQRVSQRSIFMVFALLGGYAMFQFSALYLVLVFFLGFVQMRVMRLRGLIAMMLGLFTPYWILYGFGVISYADFKTAVINDSWQPGGMEWRLVGTCAVTALATLSLLMSNMMRIISYNAKRRACNGFFSVLTVTTIVMMCFDYRDIHIYLPVLNLCLAVQVGHSFTISGSDRKYIPILLLLMACAGMCIFNISQGL